MTLFPTLLLMSFGSLIAFGAPITYRINFTVTSGIAPASGSFTYDAAVPTFTGFTVTYQGIIFDLTNAANSPITDTSCPPACAAASFLFLSTHPGGSSSGNDGWGAISDASNDIFAFHRSIPPVVGSVLFSQIMTPGTGPLVAPASTGSFSIEPVPEPTSGAMVLAGAALLGYFVHRRRNWRQVASETVASQFFRNLF